MKNTLSLFFFFSCFLLHNETINIWSHFIGFMIFLYYMLIMIFYPPAMASPYDMAPITVQLITYQVISRIGYNYTSMFINLMEKRILLTKMEKNTFIFFLDMYDIICLVSHIFLPFWTSPSKLARNRSFWNYLGYVRYLCTLFMSSFWLSFCKYINNKLICLLGEYDKIILPKFLNLSFSISICNDAF